MQEVNTETSLIRRLEVRSEEFYEASNYAKRGPEVAKADAATGDLLYEAAQALRKTQAPTTPQDMEALAAWHDEQERRAEVASKFAIGHPECDGWEQRAEHNDGVAEFHRAAAHALRQKCEDAVAGGLMRNMFEQHTSFAVDQGNDGVRVGTLVWGSGLKHRVHAVGPNLASAVRAAGRPTA